MDDTPNQIHRMEPLQAHPHQEKTSACQSSWLSLAAWSVEQED